MRFLLNKHREPDEIRRENITWVFPGIRFRDTCRILPRTERQVIKEKKAFSQNYKILRPLILVTRRKI